MPTGPFMLLPLTEVAPYFSPRRLRLLILPTEKCNFRCTYCYEDFTVGQMNSQTADAVIALVQNRAADLDSLDVDWFGGEPLLAQRVVYLVGSAIADICHRSAIDYRGSITTNGFLLTPEVARELLLRGVSHFQVSLDGPEEVHNLRRPTALGRPTFRIITDNLRELLKIDREFQLQIRVHFDRTTYPRVRDFVASDVSRWAEDSRVDVLFVQVENLSADVEAHVPQFTAQERKNAIAELRTFVSRGITKGDSPYVCYAAQPNAFVIRADGRIGKCTVALNDERNTIGRITPDGQLLVDGERVVPWMEGWATADGTQLSCPYSHIKKVPYNPTVARANLIPLMSR